MLLQQYYNVGTYRSRALLLTFESQRALLSFVLGTRAPVLYGQSEPEMALRNSGENLMLTTALTCRCQYICWTKF